MGYLEDRAARKNGLAPKLSFKKEPKPMKRVSDKRAAELKEQKVIGKPPSQLELEHWFHTIQMRHFTEFGGQCMECGAYIPNQFARHATAHLLPKKLFKSVATHELNYLILGAGCGCHVKTDRVDLFVKMKVWPEAARRIKKMLPLLPFDELKYVSSQLLTALDNTP